MKKIRLLSLLGLALLSASLLGCGTKTNNGDVIIEDVTSSTNDVVDYNDSLVDIATDCILAEDDVWNAYNDASTPVSDIESAIQSTLSTCQASINQIQTIWNRQWDSSLKDGILAVLTKDVEYYSTLLNILPYIDVENLTEEEAANYDAVLDQLDIIDQELTAANENLIAIQDQFSQNHWFELEESN